MIKQGDILIWKDSEEKYKVLGICGEVYFLSHPDQFDYLGNPYTYYELKQYFKLDE